MEFFLVKRMTKLSRLHANFISGVESVTLNWKKKNKRLKLRHKFNKI